MNTALVLQLLSLCEKVYESADIVAGPHGIHGAALSVLPTGEIVLAFRGTLANHDQQSILDWVSDFHAELVTADDMPGRVHAGFLTALDALWQPILEALAGAANRQAIPLPPPLLWQRIVNFFHPHPLQLPVPELHNRKLVLCGHSKGGALATLAAVRLAALKPTVVTFAAPKAGDAAFAANYPEEVALTRIEGDYDLVPHLPPYLFGYHEVGTVIRQGVIPLTLREAAINRLVATGQWQRIREAHALDTGYRPWLKDLPPAAEGRVAA